MYDDRKQIVIDKIKHILQNNKNEPLLDEIAELGAELETTEDTEYAANIIHEIKEKLGQIN